MHDDLDHTGEKFCPRCERWRKLSAFHTNRHKPDGLQVYCRYCVQEVNAARYQREKSRSPYDEDERTQRRRNAGLFYGRSVVFISYNRYQFESAAYGGGWRRDQRAIPRNHVYGDVPAGYVHWGTVAGMDHKTVDILLKEPFGGTYFLTVNIDMVYVTEKVLRDVRTMEAERDARSQPNGHRKVKAVEVEAAVEAVAEGSGVAA